MIRSTLKENQKKNDTSGFRFRGTDNTRIEALSDGIFAIATALLIISTSIPETYAELISFMKDLIPFAICMALLILIWHQHYLFFIRYGFKDVKIVAINTLLLFLILFYIYPLKFLFTFLNNLFTAIFQSDNKQLDYLFTEVILIENSPNLMVIYGLGAASIFLTLAWMYRIAYQRRILLSLTKLEAFDTQSSVYVNLWMSSVPLLSSLISIMPFDAMNRFMIAGWIYMIYPLVMIPTSIYRQRKRKLVEN